MKNQTVTTKRIYATELHRVNLTDEEFADLRNVVWERNLIIAVRGEDFKGENRLKTYNEFWTKMAEEGCSVITNRPPSKSGWAHARFIEPKDVCTAISILKEME